MGAVEGGEVWEQWREVRCGSRRGEVWEQGREVRCGSRGGR